jgi:hypothetical protein
MKITHDSEHINRGVVITLLSVMLFMQTSIAADQKYNPHTQKWETVAPDSVQKYNPYSREWETTSPDSVMKYNPYEHDWQYTKPDSKPIYNPYEQEWQMKK